MESNTHSTPQAPPDEFTLLAAAVDALAARNLAALPDAQAAQRVLVLRTLVDRLEGHWLRELAGVDGRGAAGAEVGGQAPSTAGWLRARLRAGYPQAHRWVQTARALFRGPLAATGKALTGGELSPAHAAVLAAGTHDLPAATATEAEPVLLGVAGRLDPPTLRKVVAHLREVADPDGADTRIQHQHARRGLWVSPTLAGMVAIDGLLEPEAGETLLAALDPLARPTGAEDDRSGSQRRADALTELARRNLEGGRLPQTGGVRPQVTVTVDLASLLGEPGSPGGTGAWTGPLPAETARRLACDATLTRVLVARHPHPASVGDGDPTADPPDLHHPAWADDRGDDHHGHHQPGHDPDATGELAVRLQAALALLPVALGGPATQPLEVGRATRVVSPAQRTALTVRDGGCVFPGCDRPPGWCEAHHLRHWLHGGPTDLGNLVLLCWTHHRAVHEGGQRLHPPHRQRPTAA
jgi:Domain of unknown function (DUF222)/HNH endonuclease